MKKMVIAYINEMGNLAEKYVEFKDKYNTSIKIANNVSGFKKEYRFILSALENRLKKEDLELYPLAERI